MSAQDSSSLGSLGVPWSSLNSLELLGLEPLRIFLKALRVPWAPVDLSLLSLVQIENQNVKKIKARIES